MEIVGDIIVILPILIPLAGAMVALLLRRKRSLQAAWTLVTMLASFAVSCLILFIVWDSGEPLVYQSGGWAAPFGISIVADMLAAVFVVMVQLVMVNRFNRHNVNR